MKFYNKNTISSFFIALCVFFVNNTDVIMASKDSAVPNEQALLFEKGYVQIPVQQKQELTISSVPKKIIQMKNVSGDENDHDVSIEIMPEFKYAKSQSLDYIRKNDIKTIGFFRRVTPELEALYNKMIEKEIELNEKGYFVFYHSQVLSFLVYHDIIKILFNICHGIDLGDFRLMRVFNEAFKKTCKNCDSDSFWDFLKAYNFSPNDFEDDQRKMLLSVSSLFVNTGGMSALFFFNSEWGSLTWLRLSFIEDVFDYFGIKTLYNKYIVFFKSLFKVLCKSRGFLPKDVSSLEGAHAGGLMVQIGIPEKEVENIVYKSLDCGEPQELKVERYHLSYAYTQFRICLLSKYFADPKNPYNIKMFTYNCAEFNTDVTSEEYKNYVEYKKLLIELENDLKKDLILSCENFDFQGGDAGIGEFQEGFENGVFGVLNENVCKRKENPKNHNKENVKKRKKNK